jgi:O-antigen/teichoic acid export membrane protein
VLLNLLGEFGTLLIGFVPAILVARWLGPSGRGLLGVIGTTSSIAFIVSSAGLPMAVWYWASKKKPPTGALLGNSLAYAAFLAALFMPVAWIFRDELSDLLAKGQGQTVWIFAAAVIPIAFLDWTTHNQLLGAQRFGYYNLLIILQKIMYFAGIVVFLRFVDLGVSGVFLAGISGSLLLIGGALRVIIPEGRPRLDRDLARKLFGYGTRTQIGAIFRYMNSRFDVLILQFFVPLSSVGYYVISQTLAELVLMIARSFQSSILPLVTRGSEEAEGPDATAATLLRHHGVLTVLAVIANAFFSPLLILVAYGPAYYSALLPFFIILPGVWFLGSGLVISNDLNARNRPVAASALSGTAVLVTIILDLVLIPLFGVPGAAVASLIAYLVYGVASFITLSRIAGSPVREFIPKRSDLALYAAAIREAPGRIRSSRASRQKAG